MVFIVSDQRIATENFEKGKIYKVVFLDESIFYGVCIGIGSNFVMLSGNISGYLFPLTMETASQVESIDLYTPVEPEPPVPPMTNLLQYQTGVPPFDFTTSGANLWSYFIQGAAEGCGEITNNLWNGATIEAGRLDNGDVGYKSDTTNITFSDDILSFTTTANYRGVVSDLMPIDNEMRISYTLSSLMTKKVAWYAADTTFLSQTTYTTSDYRSGMLLSPPENAKYFRISFEPPTAGTYTIAYPKLNEGPTALPYEPYGYKIPIVCGGQTTNIYIDNPIGADDILYSIQTGIQIPTIVGDNTLSVNTTVQPSEMQIVYKIADR